MDAHQAACRYYLPSYEELRQREFVLDDGSNWDLQEPALAS
jgi:hypothetical protein